MDDVSRKLAAYEREAWAPVLEGHEDAPAVSKFSGTPFLTCPWPVCQSCAEPMLFLLQLKISELPALPGGWLSSPTYELNREHGLIQVFNCNEPECVLNSGEPYSGSSFTSISYTWHGVQTAAMRPGKPPIGPPRIITGWHPMTDTPCKEELLDLDLGIQTDELFELSKLHYPGDKLLGWPTAANGTEHPCCHLCGSKMRFLYQIAELPFGNPGARGFVYVCPEHPVTAFCWANGKSSRVAGEESEI